MSLDLRDFRTGGGPQCRDDRRGPRYFGNDRRLIVHGPLESLCNSRVWSTGTWSSVTHL